MARNETSWFKHDFNARRDQKILTMRLVYGGEGYGWYWMLIEMMREATDYKLRLSGKYSIQALAVELGADQGMLANFILDCINEFHLFESDGEYFWSISLLKRMKVYNEVCEARSEAAGSRWESDLNNREKRSVRLAEARKKGKHTKEEWAEMKEFFHNTCVKCNGDSGLVGVVKDHIKPIYQGGSDGIENIQPLCVKCNAAKGPEDKDYREVYCQQHEIKMPTKWLQNACKMPATRVD